MFVNEVAARKLLVALGKEEAGEWSRKRLLLKLNNLPSEVGDATPTEKDDKVLFRAICKALENDEKIEYEVENNGEAAPPADEKPNKKKKGKEKATEDATTASEKKGRGKKKENDAAVPTEEKEKIRRTRKGPDGGPSNKEVVYKLWEKNKDKGTSKAEEYHSKVGERVKLTTIKSWISSWGRGQNLPSCAR